MSTTTADTKWYGTLESLGISPEEVPLSEQELRSELASVSGEDALDWDATVPGSPAHRSGVVNLRLGRKINTSPSSTDER